MKNAKILFIDDDVQIQNVYLKILGTRDHIVYQAFSGQEAIDIYLDKKDIIDIIILDMTLGIGIDGHQVYYKLNDINPNIKVVVCSGYSSNIKIIDDLIVKPNCKYLSKPINNNELLAIIDKLPLFKKDS